MTHASKKTNKAAQREELHNKGEKNMTNAIYYVVIVILTAIFVTGTAFATIKDATSEEPASTNNASISFTDGNVSCDGKTGWQMIGDLADSIR